MRVISYTQLYQLELMSVIHKTQSYTYTAILNISQGFWQENTSEKVSWYIYIQYTKKKYEIENVV